MWGEGERVTRAAAWVQCYGGSCTPTHPPSFLSALRAQKLSLCSSGLLCLFKPTGDRGHRGHRGAPVYHRPHEVGADSLFFLSILCVSGRGRGCRTKANIGLNAVPSIDAFVSDINHGKWDKVLSQVRRRRRVGGAGVARFEETTATGLVSLGNRACGAR